MAGGASVRAAESWRIVTGSSVAATCVALGAMGSHLRITLALMPWLKAMADTEAPGAMHCATTSALNCPLYVRRKRTPVERDLAPGSCFTIASTIFIVDAIFMPPSQLGKRVVVGLLRVKRH